MRYFFTQTWCLKHQPDEKHQSQANYKRQDKHQNQTVSLGSLVLCTIMLFARPRFNLQPYMFKEAYFIFLEINMDRVEKTTEGPLPTNWTRVPCRPPWGLFFHIAQEGVLSDEHFTNGGTLMVCLTINVFFSWRVSFIEETKRKKSVFLNLTV